MEHRPGAIGLTVIDGLVGKLVWALQALNGDLSKFTHVFVVLDNGELFSARPGGAVILPDDHYEGRPIAYVDVPLTGKQQAAIVATARELAGTPYSWGSYLFMAAERLHLPWAADWMRHRVETSGRMICSQAADYIYNANGIHLFSDGRQPYNTTPGDFARLLEHQ